MKKESTKATKNESISCNTSSTNNITLIAQRTSDLTPTVAKNLKTLIDTQEINQKILSEKTGYCEAAISKYVTAKQLPQLDFFFALKKLYNISIDDFLSKEIRPIDVPSISSTLEQEEELLYHKFYGTYLIYYLDTSSYKGRDNNSPEESLMYGIIHLYAGRNNLKSAEHNCVAILGLDNRSMATALKKKFDSFHSYSDIEKYLHNPAEGSLASKAYYGNFEFNNNHVFLSISHSRKDKALIILHRVNTNKRNYIGGIGTINSVSKGRESTPTAQYIALSRYPITLSAEEIHHHLLLSHPTYKADDDVKSLIHLFKKNYMVSDETSEELTELQKQLIIKVNLERYIKDSLKRNMFRYAKISNRDDEAWYKILKEVSITEIDEDIPNDPTTH